MAVSYPGEVGKTINEMMIDGGCVQKLRVSTCIKVFCISLYDLA